MNFGAWTFKVTCWITHTGGVVVIPARSLSTSVAVDTFVATVGEDIDLAGIASVLVPGEIGLKSAAVAASSLPTLRVTSS